MKLPPKTVERLSQYRRVLKKYEELEGSHIFSHDLARLLKINPVQVRRDLMLIGFSGNYRNGYKVQNLIKLIDKTLSTPKSQNTAIIGMGKLGNAILQHVYPSNVCPVSVKAAFDVNPKRINKDFNGVHCYDISKIPEIVKENNIKIAILTISDDDIQAIVDALIEAGVKGIVNYIAGPIRVPDEIYFKEYDIRTTLEEMSYFID